MIKITSDEKIKDAVRQTYGGLARRFTEESDPAAERPARASCCGPEEKPTEHTGIAPLLYSDEEITGLPESVTGSSLGCGNPTAIAELQPSEVVLDLGSGGGIDCFLAARQVGPEGRVIGLDMTTDMIKLARRNAKKVGLSNVEFRYGEMEDIPLPDESVDVIISNCVINLSPDKDAVFREAFRVLRPGGRMMVSDIVVDGKLPQPLRERLDAWAGCIAGALEESDYLGKIRAAGFERVEVVSRNHMPAEQAAEGDDVQIVIVGADGQVEGEEAKAMLAEAGVSPLELAQAIASIKVKAYKPANARRQEEHGLRPETEPACAGSPATEQQGIIPMPADCLNLSDPGDVVLFESRPIPFDFVGNKIYLPVRINDLEPSNFVLDTGAPAWFIDLEHARALGLPLNDSVDLLCMGAGSEDKSSAYHLSGLSLGLPGLKLDGQTALTLPMPGCNLGYPAIQGIAGGSFIGRFVVAFDFINHVMTLHEPSTYEYRGSGTIVPIKLMGGIPFVQATLTPRGREPIAALFVLDMGFGGVVSLNTPFVHAHNLADDSQQLLRSILGFGVGGPVYGSIGRIEALQLGSYTMEAPICALSNTSQGAHAQAGFVGTIGMELLRRFHLILDYSRQRIILEKNAHFATPYEHDMSGVVLTIADEGFRVEAVIEGSPATDAGIQAGDLITHVDGQRAANVDLTDLRQAFLQAGNTHHLQVNRGGEQRQVALTLRRLI